MRGWSRRCWRRYRAIARRDGAGHAGCSVDRGRCTGQAWTADLGGTDLFREDARAWNGRRAGHRFRGRNREAALGPISAGARRSAAVDRGGRALADGPPRRRRRRRPCRPLFSVEQPRLSTDRRGRRKQRSSRSDLDRILPPTAHSSLSCSTMAVVERSRSMTPPPADAGFRFGPVRRRSRLRSRRTARRWSAATATASPTSECSKRESSRRADPSKPGARSTASPSTRRAGRSSSAEPTARPGSSTLRRTRRSAHHWAPIRARPRRRCLRGEPMRHPDDRIPNGGPPAVPTLTRWNLRAGFLAARACSVARRNLTRLEWEQILPNLRYRKVCGGSPLAQ